MNDLKIGKKLEQKLKIVHSYLLKMGATKEDAEDVIQDTAYKFLRYVDSIDFRNIEGWLFRVAVNQYYDLSRKQTRRQEILLKFNFEHLVEESTPETIAIENEFSEEVQIVLSKLKSNYREILVLKYSTGLKISEIASLFNMKEGSVKTILHRARTQFIQEYRRQENE